MYLTELFQKISDESKQSKTHRVFIIEVDDILFLNAFVSFIYLFSYKNIYDFFKYDKYVHVYFVFRGGVLDADRLFYNHTISIRYYI